jgi:bacterioferritin-associated ferredoxin
MSFKIGIAAEDEEPTVFVCICRAVTASRLRAVVDGGACTLDAVERACGAGSDCGTCRDEIAGVIRERASASDSEAA